MKNFSFIIPVLLVLANSISAGNLPTFTVSRQATIRFPSEPNSAENLTKKHEPKVNKSLLIEWPSEENKTDIVTTTIKPTKSVQVIGNYSIAVQQATKVKTKDGVEEIIEKTSSLLDLLDFLRQLPREKLAEIYFGKDESKKETNGTVQKPQSSTESVLEFLNNLRERPVSTSTKASTTLSTSTISSNVAESSEVVTTDYEITTVPSSEDEKDTIPPDLLFNEDLDLFNETETESIVVTSDIDDTNSTLTIDKLYIINTTQIPAQETSTKSSTTSTITTSTSTNQYEFTDYPPPLPPPLTETEESFKRDHHQQGQQSGYDTSFAVGVAVGILACVVVASTGVTWCVCRRHWGRRNVYATMEAEEIPRAFTKPGPPVILPEEINRASRRGRGESTRFKSQFNSTLDDDQISNRVTEL